MSLYQIMYYCNVWTSRLVVTIMEWKLQQTTEIMLPTATCCNEAHWIVCIYARSSKSSPELEQSSITDINLKTSMLSLLMYDLSYYGKLSTFWAHVRLSSLHILDMHVFWILPTFFGYIHAYVIYVACFVYLSFFFLFCLNFWSSVLSVPILGSPRTNSESLGSQISCHFCLCGLFIG